MKNKIFIFALILAFVIGTTLGISRLVTTPARAQNSNTETQIGQQNGNDEKEAGVVEEKEKTEEKENFEKKEDVEEKDEAEEPADEQEQEENLPGGGHQDSDGVNVEHQFEGVE